MPRLLKGDSIRVRLRRLGIPRIVLGKFWKKLIFEVGGRCAFKGILLHLIGDRYAEGGFMPSFQTNQLMDFDFGHREGAVAVDLLTLLQAVKEELTASFPQSLWVKAEIAQIQLKNHCYLELVQSRNGVQKAKARGIIWASQYPLIAHKFLKITGSQLSIGQQVLLHCRVNFSELYSFSLIIDDISPEYTLGDAERRKRETIERLEKEGLFDRQKGLSLARLPYHLAVISASDAAGYGDFCKHLKENPYGFVFDVRLFPAVMQGESSPESIAQAISHVVDAAGVGLPGQGKDCENMDGAVKHVGRVAGEGKNGQEGESSGFDAILIMRGGGANLDLACYDDYTLAKAIALCPIPVFTAIGHERDNHIADMVAFEYVKTPTALADKFIAMYCAEDEQISYYEDRIRTLVLSSLSHSVASLDGIEKRIASAVNSSIAREMSVLGWLEKRVTIAVDNALTRDSDALENVFRRIYSAGNASISRGGFTLDNCRSRIMAAARVALSRDFALLDEYERRSIASNPENILKRGFTLTTTPNGKVLRSAGLAASQVEMRIVFADGEVKVRREQ